MAGLFSSIVAIVLLTAAEAMPRVAADLDAQSTLLWLLALLAAAAATGWVAGNLAAARALRGEGSPFAALRRGRRAVTGVSLAGFALALFLGDWGILPRTWVPVEVPLAAHLIALAPYPLALVLGFATLARSIPARHGSALRPHLVPMLPYLLLMALYDLGWHFPGAREATATDPRAALLGLVALALLVLLLSPFMVRFLWPSSSLPDGELRRRLFTLAARARVRCRDIRIWHTGHPGIVNALITGVAGPVRYIFITDALLRDASHDELEQVFAHELGHARRQHFAVYTAMVFAFLLCLEGAEHALPENPHLAALVILAAALLYFRWFFGILSRQLESDADLFAADLTGDPAMVARALEHIGFLTGGMHTASGWRHHSILKRIEILWKATHDRSFRRAFRRRTRLIQGLVAAAFLAGSVVCARELVEDARRPSWELALRRADYLVGEYEERGIHPRRKPEIEQGLLARAAEQLRSAQEDLAQSPELRERRISVLEELAQVLIQMGELSRAHEVRVLAARLRAGR